MNPKKVQPKKQEKKQTKVQDKAKKQSKGNAYLNHNILQTMKNQIDFLRIFNSQQIQFLFDNYDSIVFQRGMILAKEKQIIDYVGVILNGGAIGQITKCKLKKNSFIGHGVTLYGLEGQIHPQTIIAESDGIMFSIRIQTIINLTKNEVQNSIKTKIMNFLAQQTLCQLRKQKHFKSTTESQFQIVQQKIGHKFYQSNKLLFSVVEGISDMKQKQKFYQQFPLLCVKEKTLIASKNSKPYFLIVVKGQIVAKYGLGIKKQVKVLQNNIIYNAQGFIFDHNQFSNLYCTSSEAVFLLVQKENLANNFKLMTQCAVLKCCLNHIQKVNQFQFNNVKAILEQQNLKNNKNLWSPFKKPYVIEEIPIKKEGTKKSTTHGGNNKKKQSINAFQTLYQLYSQSSSKNKLHSKQTQMTEYKDSGQTQKAITLKTQHSIEQKPQNTTPNNEKLKKLQNQISNLKDQNKVLTDAIKKLKLDLVESQAKLKMVEVFRQLRKKKDSKQNKNQVSSNTISEGNSVTLKKAFQIHLKNKKLQLLVAKCAFKWLQITRRNRNKRQNLQSNASLTKSMVITK